MSKVLVGGVSSGVSTIRARALVGFYRGDLVNPGDILDLPSLEFWELHAMNKVEQVAPDTEVKAAAAPVVDKSKK